MNSIHLVSHRMFVAAIAQQAQAGQAVSPARSGSRANSSKVLSLTPLAPQESLPAKKLRPLRIVPMKGRP